MPTTLPLKANATRLLPANGCQSLPAAITHLPQIPPSDLVLPAESLTGTDEQFRQLVACVSEYAIYMLDPMGRLVSWNAGAERATGYRAEEVLGLSFSIFFTPEDVAAGEPQKELEAARRDGHFESSAWRVCRDGRRSWNRITLNAIHATTGELLGFATVSRDISQQRKREEDLHTLNAHLEAGTDVLETRVMNRTREFEQTIEELNRRNTEVESFVYTVSHDLRAPLVNLQGFACELASSCQQLQNLLSGVSLPPERASSIETLLSEEIPEALHYISISVHKFDRLTEALLSLSRLGRQVYHIVEVNAREVVQNSIGSLQASIEQTGATISLGDLPPCQGDLTAIGQIFANLLSNAIKYRSPERPLKLRIEGRREAAQVHYWVRDNGLGIPQSAIKRLFQVFQRLHPGQAEGEGMGLAIIKRIIERHGGRIWAKSIEGVGSTFHFTLPASHPHPLTAAEKENRHA